MSAGARALVRPRGLERLHELSLDRVAVVKALVVDFLLRAPPARPLPLLRAVAHQGALVAGDGDEDVRALAGQAVFEPAPGAGALAVVRARPVVLGLEVAQLAVALVPAVAGEVLDERVLCWEAAAWADVLPWVHAMLVLVPVVLLEVLGGCWVYRVHGCLVGMDVDVDVDVNGRLGFCLESSEYMDDLYRSWYRQKFDFALHCAYVCIVDHFHIKRMLARHLWQSMTARYKAKRQEVNLNDSKKRVC
jgi:hypothetical protein